MGRILCDKHGRSPIELVCTHFAATTTLPTHCIVTVQIAGETTDIRCCEHCATQLRAAAASSEADLERELQDAETVCARCMGELGLGI